MRYYVCGKCFYINTVDYWYCPSCDDENILELTVEKEPISTKFEFANDDLLDEVKNKLIKAYIEVIN